MMTENKQAIRSSLCGQLNSVQMILDLILTPYALRRLKSKKVKRRELTTEIRRLTAGFNEGV